MKKIKLLGLFVFLLCLAQFASAQSRQTTTTDENGRPIGTRPAAVAKENAATARTLNDVQFNGSDMDDPSKKTVSRSADNKVSEWVLPNDLDILNAEMNESSAPSRDMADKMAQLEERIKELSLFVEQLSLENRVVKKSLNNCCADNVTGLSHEGAYLLQNAPNPFKQSADVNYFLPNDTKNARLEIRNINGDIVKSISLEKTGLASIKLDATSLPAGTYTYSLFAGREIIDSKVMIVTQ